MIDLLEPANTPPLPKPQPPPRRWLPWLSAAACFLVLASISLGLLLRGKNADAPLGEDFPGVLGNGPTTPVAMSNGHKGRCTSIAFMPDGLYAISEDGGGEIVIWDLRKRRCKEPIPHQSAKPLEKSSGIVAVSPDGTVFAAAGVPPGADYMCLLAMYDQKTYQRVGKDYHFIRLGPTLAFSPDGAKLAAVELPGILNQIVQPLFGSGKIHLKILDIQAGKWKQFPIPKPVTGLAFSPDGKFLISCSDENHLCLWNLDQDRKERDIAAHQGGTDQVAFSADGQHIYTASSADDTMRVWQNDNDNKEVRQIPFSKTTAKMVCCAFWKNGRALTGHVDGSVIAWDLDKGEKLKAFPGKDVPTTAVAISPDGHHAVAAHSDHGVYLYRLPPPQAKP